MFPGMLRRAPDLAEGRAFEATPLLPDWIAHEPPTHRRALQWPGDLDREPTCRGTQTRWIPQEVAGSWCLPLSVQRTVVGYNGSPSYFMVGLTEGRQDLATVDAPNAYAKSRLDIYAPNGWTITVHNYGTDAPDDAEALATIGNAALDLIGS